MLTRKCYRKKYSFLSLHFIQKHMVEIEYVTFHARYRLVNILRMAALKVNRTEQQQQKASERQKSWFKISRFCEFHVCTWMGKNVTRSIIYVFKQWVQAHKCKHILRTNVRTYVHTKSKLAYVCAKQPTIKMTMRLFEYELMCPLSVFISLILSIQKHISYKLQISRII